MKKIPSYSYDCSYKTAIFGEIMWGKTLASVTLYKLGLMHLVESNYVTTLELYKFLQKVKLKWINYRIMWIFCLVYYERFNLFHWGSILEWYCVNMQIYTAIYSNITEAAIVIFWVSIDIFFWYENRKFCFSAVFDGRYITISILMPNSRTLTLIVSSLYDNVSLSWNIYEIIVHHRCQ